MQNPATTEPPAEEILNIAHAIAAPFVGRNVRDTEEFTDVYLALIKARGSYNPWRSLYSTFAYTVGRRAIMQGRKSRRAISVQAHGEFEGYDAGDDDSRFHQIEVQDEYNHVMSSAALSPSEKRSLGSDSPHARDTRHRAIHKMTDSAERRSQLYK